MQGGTQTFEGIERHGRPLCCRYLLLHVEAVSTPVREDGPLRDQTVRWALGVLADGQHEMLGVWPANDGAPASANLVAADLRARGVQRVDVLIHGESDELRAAFLRAFPEASAASPFHPVAQKAISGVTPRGRKGASEGLARIRRAQSQEHANAVLDALAASTWQGASGLVQVCRAAIRQWHALYALSRRARARVIRGEDAARVLQQGLSQALARHGHFDSAETAAAYAEAWLLETERRQRRRMLDLRYRADVAAARAAA
jgi:transposase-like protein